MKLSSFIPIHITVDNHRRLYVSDIKINGTSRYYQLYEVFSFLGLGLGRGFKQDKDGNLYAIWDHELAWNR